MLPTKEVSLYLATEEPGVYLAEMAAQDRTHLDHTIASSLDGQPQPSIDVMHDPNRRVLGVWDDDTLVGAVGLKEDEVATIDFWTGRDYEGLGYATIAVRAATKYALRESSSIRATLANRDAKAVRVLEKAGYKPVGDSADMLTFEYAADTEGIYRTGVIKMRATNGSDGTHGTTDSAVIEQHPDARSRFIKKFSGSKNRALYDALTEAIDYATRHPLGAGSKKVQGIKGAEPTIGGHRVAIWRLKPSDVPSLQCARALRDVRILYGIVDDTDGQKVLALLDIIRRGDFAKKYT